MLFTSVDPDRQGAPPRPLPDAVVFETEDMTPVAGDPLADILARLEAVQTELQAIREAVSDLQE